MLKHTALLTILVALLTSAGFAQNPTGSVRGKITNVYYEPALVTPASIEITKADGTTVDIWLASEARTPAAAANLERWMNNGNDVFVSYTIKEYEEGGEYFESYRITVYKKTESSQQASSQQYDSDLVTARN